MRTRAENQFYVYSSRKLFISVYARIYAYIIIILISGEQRTTNFKAHQLHISVIVNVTNNGWQKIKFEVIQIETNVQHSRWYHTAVADSKCLP